MATIRVSALECLKNVSSQSLLKLARNPVPISLHSSSKILSGSEGYIAAPEAFSHSFGGVLQAWTASPNARVDSIREDRNSFCSEGVKRVCMDFPVRLISTSADSSSSIQSPACLASHCLFLTLPFDMEADRLRMTTSSNLLDRCSIRR